MLNISTRLAEHSMGFAEHFDEIQGMRISYLEISFFAYLFIVDVEVDNHQSDMSRSVPVRSLLKTKDRPAIWPENTAIESAI